MEIPLKGCFIVLLATVLSWNVRQLCRGSLHAICYFVMLCSVQWILPFRDNDGNSSEGMFTVILATVLSWNVRQLCRGSLHAICYFVMLCSVQWILPFRDNDGNSSEGMFTVILATVLSWNVRQLYRGSLRHSLIAKPYLTCRRFLQCSAKQAWLVDGSSSPSVLAYLLHLSLFCPNLLCQFCAAACLGEVTVHLECSTVTAIVIINV